METVNRHRPIHGRSNIAGGGDCGQLNLVAAASKRMGQISDVALLSTATRRVELREHQDTHGARNVPQLLRGGLTDGVYLVLRVTLRSSRGAASMCTQRRGNP